MKVHKEMKKKVGRHQKILKRPSIHKKAWRENVRNKTAQKKVQKQKENVEARARRAARKGLPYQTTCAELTDLAVAAYARAMQRANSAHETADKALEAADEAKKDAAQNSKRITTLEGKVKTGLETLAARAKRSEDRLTSDERMRGYIFS